jgi:hypothetical protein
MSSTIITTKEQATIPVDIMDLPNVLPKPKRQATIEEIEQATQKGYTRRYERN